MMYMVIDKVSLDLYDLRVAYQLWQLSDHKPRTENTLCPLENRMQIRFCSGIHYRVLSRKDITQVYSRVVPDMSPAHK